MCKPERWGNRVAIRMTPTPCDAQCTGNRLYPIGATAGRSRRISFTQSSEEPHQHLDRDLLRPGCGTRLRLVATDREDRHAGLIESAAAIERASAIRCERHVAVRRARCLPRPPNTEQGDQILREQPDNDDDDHDAYPLLAFRG